MQATGQYGLPAAYASSHGHIFNLSHDMSLPPSVAGHSHDAGHTAGTGQDHSLSLSQYPQPPSRQSQQLFLQDQSRSLQQQQHAEFTAVNNNMGATPKLSTAQTSAPLYPNVSQTPASQQHSQSLQSAAQQLQADIYHHHHHQQHQQQQKPQQSIISDRTQQNHQQPIADHLHAQRNEQSSHFTASQQQQSPQDRKLPAEGVVTMGAAGTTSREEHSLDGDEPDVLGTDDGERVSGGGNRWPRQEAHALLKIRSDMDAVFRDSSLKGPLWEEVSRKLAEMGYRRSSKKCKEKFENVHKYYKRTKDGKAGRQDGKSYRFFTQLEALYSKAADNIHQNTSPINSKTPATLITAARNTETHSHAAIIAAPPSAAGTSASAAASTAATTPAAPPTNPHLLRPELNKHESDQNSSGFHFSYLESSDDDDNYDDDEIDDDPPPATIDLVTPSVPNTSAAAIKSGSSIPNRKRKRESIHKYLTLFERVLQKVLDKQEHMQQRFLQALEKRDQDRMMKEEAWRRQEMARLNQEHDLRVAERALSASRDSSLITLLQKITGQTVTFPPTPISTLHPTPINFQPSSAIVPLDYMQNEHLSDKDMYDPSNRRWPKPEVLALIKLRVHLDARFHEPGSKAMLWDEISSGMTTQGFNRTAKRCKEKWENINKYFKKARESSKVRSENAKTCPYFHHLEALYKEGLLRGGSVAMPGTKHILMVTEKGEANSDEDVIDQKQNTSNRGDDRSDCQAGKERDSEVVGQSTNGTAIPMRTNTISTDAAMHLFMSSDQNSGMKEVGMNTKKLMPSFNGSPNSTTESAITGKDGAGTFGIVPARPRTSDHGMSTSISLSSMGNQPSASVEQA